MALAAAGRKVGGGVNMIPEVLDVLEGRSQWHLECADALQFLTTLPDGCVNAVITDPPF